MPDILKNLRSIIAVYICITLFHSCNIINPTEKIPTYLHVDSFQFVGAASHEISTVIAYYNNSPIGTFDLPATIPILAEGNGNVQLFPGIVSNGQNDRMLTYIFYKPDVYALTAQPGTVVNYIPKTRYDSAVKFYTISDFEFGQIKMSKAAGNVSITAVTDPALVFDGSGTGSILLTAAGDSSVDSSNIAFPIKNGAAFIEFDYKTQIPFAVGIQAELAGLYTVDPYYLAGLNPTDKWRKFYLNVSGYITQYNATAYRFYLRTSLPANLTNGRLLIDNIKLVTF